MASRIPKRLSRVCRAPNASVRIALALGVCLLGARSVGARTMRVNSIGAGPVGGSRIGAGAIRAGAAGAQSVGAQPKRATAPRSADPVGFDDLLRFATLVVRGEIVESIELPREARRTADAPLARVVIVRRDEVLLGELESERVAVLVDDMPRTTDAIWRRGARGAWFLRRDESSLGAVTDAAREGRAELAAAIARALDAGPLMRAAVRGQGVAFERIGGPEPLYPLYVPSTIVAATPNLCVDASAWTARELGVLLRERRAYLAAQPLLEVERRSVDATRDWTLRLNADLSYRLLVRDEHGTRVESGAYPVERWLKLEPLRWSDTFWSVPRRASASFGELEPLASLQSLPDGGVRAEQALLRLHRGARRLELVLPLAKGALWRRGDAEVAELRALELWMGLPPEWRAR